MTRSTADQERVEIMSDALQDRRVLSAEVTIDGTRYFVLNDSRAIREGKAHVLDVLHLKVRAAPSALREAATGAPSGSAPPPAPRRNS